MNEMIFVVQNSELTTQVESCARGSEAKVKPSEEGLRTAQGRSTQLISLVSGFDLFNDYMANSNS